MKYLKILLKVVAAIFLVMVLLWGIFHLPVVQTYLLRKITTQISEFLQTKVEIGDAKIRFIGNSTFRDVVISDSESDTLFAAQLLKVDLRLRSLLRKQIYFSSIFIENSRVKLYQPPDADHMNYSFLLNRISSGDTTKPDSPGWNIGVHKMDLENLTFTMDRPDVLNVSSRISKLTLNVERLNLDAQEVHFNQVHLADSRLSVNYSEYPDTIQSPKQAIQFPYTGWNLSAKKIRLSNNQIFLSNSVVPDNEEAFDINHLDLSTVSLSINNFQWNENLLNARILQINAEGNEPFDVKNMKGLVNITPSSITLENLAIETDNSRINTTITLKFENFDVLSKQPGSIEGELQFSETRISQNELLSVIDTAHLGITFDGHSDIFLDGKFQKNDNRIIVKSAQVKIGDHLDLEVNGELSLGDRNEIRFHDFEIERLYTSYSNIRELLPELQIPEKLRHFGSTELKGVLNGSIQNLQARQFQITSDGINLSPSDLSVKNMGDVNNMSVKFDINKLLVYPDLTQAFVPDSLRYIVDELGAIEFTGNINGGTQHIEVRGFIDSESGSLDVTGTLNFHENYQSPNYLSSATFQADIKKLSADPNLIRVLLPDSIQQIADSLGTIQFAGTLAKQIDQLSVTGILNTHLGNIQMDVQLDNPNASQLREYLVNSTVNIEIQEFKISPGISRILLPDRLDAYADSLGFIIIEGNIEGAQNQFNLTGNLKSHLGKIDLTAGLDLTQTNRPANYMANLVLTDFHFNVFTGNTVGKTTASIKLEGEGLQLSNFKRDSLNLTWDASIKDIVLNHYQYDNIEVEGSFRESQLTSSGFVDDQYINLDFNLSARLNDSIPSFTLSMEIDSFYLHETNLSTRPLILEGNIVADLRGSTWDEMSGEISWKNWRLANDSIDIRGNEMTILSEELDGLQRKISIQSRPLELQIEGIFDISELPSIFNNYFNDYFALPTEELFNETPGRKMAHADHNFTFNLKTSELANLSQLFIPGLQQLNSVQISGRFVPQQNQFTMNTILRDVQFRGMSVDSLTVTTSADQDSIYNYLEAGNFQMDQLEIPRIQFMANLGNQVLHFSTDLHGPGDNERLVLKGKASHQDGSYTISLDRELIINQATWNVSPQNSIQIHDSQFTIHDLQLTHNGQSLQISTINHENQAGQAPVSLHVVDYEIGEIIQWIDIHGYSPRGTLNSQVQIFDIQSNPIIRGNVEIDQLEIREYLLGDLNLNVQNTNNASVVQIEGNISGGPNQIDISGSYSRNENNVEGIVDIRNLDLKSLKILDLVDIDSTKGNASGKLKVSGSFSQLVVTGNLNAEQVSTHVVFANTGFSIPSVRLTLAENEISMEQFRVLDKQGRTSTLSGSIQHQYFQDVRLNLHFESDEFQLLSTDRSDNQVFFGDMVIRGSADITGPVERMRININGSTAPGTDLTISNTNQSGSLQQPDFIIFMHPDQFNDGAIIRNRITLNNPYNFDLSANFEITPDAVAHIILDPGTGDELTCRGSGNITINLDATGFLDIAGNFVFNEGTYNFNYEGLVKKEFIIQKGSSLIFPGNTNDYRLDITAVYRTKTGTYDLIRNQATLTDIEISEANEIAEVEVRLHIRGTVNDPEMNFQIQIPGAEGSGVSSAVSRRLAQINNNPNEVNRQVLGLLFFNSFITENKNASTVSLTRSVESAAFSSLQGMISGQLNRLADEYLTGFEVNFGIESYGVEGIDNSSKITQLDVSISKGLFDDRLKVKVGSNVNLSRENLSFWSDASFASVAGDFVIEYKLNEQGNYLVRIFHLNDYSIIEDDSNYKTGVGFVIRKNLKDKVKRKKED